jgi:hypothetical protein
MLRTERSVALSGFPKYEFLFGRGGLIRFEEHFPLTSHAWLLPQLAAIVVVLLSVERSKTTTNSSELEICMHVGNL